MRFAWRIDGPVRKSGARVALLPADGGPAVWVRLGVRRTGTRASRTWTAALAPGSYVARLHASGPHGARLRRTARAAGRVTLEITSGEAPVPAPAAVTPGIFPVQGAYDLGGDDARFGAARRGHVHQGQDIMAAEGTPIVTPVAGIVHWRAYQASGAGHYVVVRGDDGRDYVFMHMQDGSVVAEKGRRVAAGEQPGERRQHRRLPRRPPALRDLARRLVLHRGLPPDRPAARPAGLGLSDLAARSARAARRRRA